MDFQYKKSFKPLTQRTQTKTNTTQTHNIIQIQQPNTSLIITTSIIISFNQVAMVMQKKALNRYLDKVANNKIYLARITLSTKCNFPTKTNKKDYIQQTVTMETNLILLLHSEIKM